LLTTLANFKTFFAKSFYRRFGTPVAFIRAVPKKTLAKQVQAVQSSFDVTKRRPNALPATLYLAQLRAQPARISMSKEPRKIVIEMEAEMPGECSVKIIHAD
jgi:hypothetical protein